MVDANVNIVIMDAGKTSFLDLFDVDVVKLVTTPEDKYGMDNEFVFVMHKSIKGLLMGMRDLTGALIYPELRTDGNILGYPVITSSKMPKLTDDAPDTKFIAFGNFKHIILAENGSEEILLGYNGDGFANGTKTLRAYKRDGLGILYPKAFAVLKTALV
jgi:HK97 family phage major capsid protein